MKEKKIFSCSPLHDQEFNYYILLTRYPKKKEKKKINNNNNVNKQRKRRKEETKKRFVLALVLAMVWTLLVLHFLGDSFLAEPIDSPQSFT